MTTPRAVTFTWHLPGDGDVFAQSAMDGMVGKPVQVYAPGYPAAAEATITEVFPADDGGLLITVAVPEDRADAVRALTARPCRGPDPVGLDLSVVDAAWGSVGGAVHRILNRVEPHGVTTNRTSKVADEVIRLDAT